MNSLEITFDNGGRTVMRLDPADFIKVSMDKSRPSDTRVRLVYLEPFTRNVKALDLFFMRPCVPEVPNGQLGPFVTSVSWDTTETARTPEDTYDMLRAKGLGVKGPKETQVTGGTQGTQGTGGHMDTGDPLGKF